MSRQDRASPLDAQGTTATSRLGANSTKKALSIPKKGTYLVIEDYNGLHLCLLLFKLSKKNGNNPSAYVVKWWSNEYGFFTKTKYFQMNFVKSEEFASFEEAKSFYEGAN